MWELNMAMLAKAAWSLLTDDSPKLWLCIMREKYGSHMIVDLDAHKPAASFTWKFIQKSSVVLDRGMDWRLGTGESIHFWEDAWLGHKSISEMLDIEPPANDLFVSDFITNELVWDRTKILEVVPTHLALRIFGVPIPRSLPQDRIVWKLSPLDIYTPKTGYEAFMGFTPEKSGAFQQIWRLPGPAKWASLLWLARRNRLHSSFLRWQRGLAAVPYCLRCLAVPETTLHIIRDGCLARHVWSSVIPSSVFDDWDFQSLDVWIDSNTAVHSSRHGLGISWRVVFACTVWFLWRWRCQACFDEDFIFPLRPCAIILHEALDVCKIWKLEADKRVSVLVPVSWSAPPSLWVKLNSDGASRGNPGMAGFGGVLRDSEGQWLLGYYGNLGICTVTVAELQALRQGLLLAWENGYRRIILETDSTTVVHLVNSTLLRGDEIGLLVFDIKQLLAREWQWKLQHQYREGNVTADLLANCGASGNIQLCILSEPPRDINLQVRHDREGVVRHRSSLRRAI